MLWWVEVTPLRTWLWELVQLLVECERTMEVKTLEVATWFAEGVECEIELVSSTVPSTVNFVASAFQSELGTWPVVVVVVVAAGVVVVVVVVVEELD